MHFMLHLMIHLTVQSRDAPKGTPERAPNNTFSNLHKDAQKGAFEVALGLHLCLHLLLQLLIYKFVQNGFNMFALCFISIEPSIFFATNGPKGTKIIQYFACKKFTEMASSTKYQEFQIWKDIRKISRVSASSACSLVQCKTQGSIMMASVTEILSANKNHMTRFLAKSICWFVMNIDKTMAINSYFKNTKRNTY